MTREQIKAKMISMIAANIQNLDLEDYIDTDDIDEFMWSVDYGRNFVE